jgi:phage tail-like protein
MDDSNLQYPAVGFHFSVNFIGLPDIADAKFMEVSGLNAELEFESLVEAGNNRFSYKLPTRTKYPNLVLKRGLLSSGSSKLADWVNSCIYFMEINPIEIQVLLLNDKLLPLKGWSFSKAYPVKMDYSGLNAKESSIVIETLELIYQYVTPINI